MKWLLDFLRCRKINTLNDREDTMQQMNAEDRAQVGAILRTHAEMQRMRSIDTEGMIARIKLGDMSAEDRDMVDDLSDMVDTCDDDADNLQRIADQYFPQG